jgi:arylsulfatase A-like enzyme
MRPLGQDVPCSALFVVWLALGLALIGCDDTPTLSADFPLHLEDHLSAAAVTGSEPPSTPPQAMEWTFTDGPEGWKAFDPPNAEVGPVTIEPIEDGIRLRLTEESSWDTGGGSRAYLGNVYVDLPDLNREDWAFVVVRARTSDEIGSIALGFNLRETADTTLQRNAFQHGGEWVEVINDGAVHSYVLRADWSYEFGGDRWEDPWTEMGFTFGGPEPEELDILSVSVVPKAGAYADEAAGVANEARGGRYHRRVLFTHAPGRIEYSVRVPEASHIDFGLGVLRNDVPVTFRVRVAAGVSEPQILFEETVRDKERWFQRSLDLSAWEGEIVSLSLETDAEEPGTAALWAAPTVSGVRTTDKPNVIFYIIDAGGADYMSAYGYNRPTTPVLEQLAEEGALFQYAYSNSSWSKTSTPSFATGLHHSVLGGYKTDTDPIPDQAVTMAEHLHAAGYQTAVLTSNPYAGTMTSMDRGADLLRDEGTDPTSTSTLELHDDFWTWRESFPGEPYFVHFQTTDVHWPWQPSPPFAGMFIDPERRARFYAWEQRLAEAAGSSEPTWLSANRYPEEAYAEAGVDRVALYDAGRALYDECLAFQDWQIGRMVERLKAEGEWEHTLLIVASDHGNDHGLGVLDSIPEGRGPNVRSHVSRIPMVIVWPERIPAGQRFIQPVSMIDMLPTILDLAGLPIPEITQGRSLAPLLLGDISESEWEPRPVVFDEFYVDWDTEELVGSIEVIDGRWGAALTIDRAGEDTEEAAEEVPEETAAAPTGEGTEEEPRLYLYDLWQDPQALNSVHGEHPELVEKYTAMLEALWEAHKALAQRFSRTGEVPLTPEQLQTLRSLGYIR